jgi:hypothetical protein
MTTTTERKQSMLKYVAAAALGAGIAAAGIGIGHANATPEEDQPGWSCVHDGNRICGPGNAEGAVAGCYQDDGTLVVPWPCWVVVNDDGSSDIYVDSSVHVGSGALPGPSA